MQKIKLIWLNSISLILACGYALPAMAQYEDVLRSLSRDQEERQALQAGRVHRDTPLSRTLSGLDATYERNLDIDNTALDISLDDAHQPMGYYIGQRYRNIMVPLSRAIVAMARQPKTAANQASLRSLQRTSQALTNHFGYWLFAQPPAGGVLAFLQGAELKPVNGNNNAARFFLLLLLSHHFPNELKPRVADYFAALPAMDYQQHRSILAGTFAQLTGYYAIGIASAPLATTTIEHLPPLSTILNTTPALQPMVDSVDALTESAFKLMLELNPQATLRLNVSLEPQIMIPPMKISIR